MKEEEIKKEKRGDWRGEVKKEKREVDERSGDECRKRKTERKVKL